MITILDYLKVLFMSWGDEPPKVFLVKNWVSITVFFSIVIFLPTYSSGYFFIFEYDYKFFTSGLPFFLVTLISTYIFTFGVFLFVCGIANDEIVPQEFEHFDFIFNDTLIFGYIINFKTNIHIFHPY